jgi:hypothetical protein
VQLTTTGMAAAQRDDFASQAFRSPDRSWRPPYPFVANECLWTTP